MIPGQLNPEDSKYIEIILRRVRVCKLYKPKFGQGQKSGLNLEEFQDLYSRDPFYAWFGLDTPLMYAAHKAAGGITSVYRQIGLGCEELFRQILCDQLDLSMQQARWSYTMPTPDGRGRTLTLDGRVAIEDITHSLKRDRLLEWTKNAGDFLGLSPQIIDAMQGCVFEVRQGYKSKDSKRQNADLVNAATAYTQGYIPVAVVLSSQIDSDIVERYQANRWLILRGYLAGTPLDSSYAFAKTVLDYDLAAFFERNHTHLRETIVDVLETLLSSNE